MDTTDLLFADKYLHHQINLLRFTAGEQKKVLAMLTTMGKELKVKLNGDLTDFGRVRVNKLLRESAEVIKKAYSGIQTEFDFVGLARAETKYVANTSFRLGVDASLPTEAVLKALASDVLIEGGPSAKWWAKQSDDLAFKFANQVRQGVSQNETIQQIVRRVIGSKRLGIPGIMETSKREAFALVHTSVMQVSNDAKLETFRENSDIVKGLRQLSTFDSHTTKICIAYSGAEWNIDGNPINGTTLPFEGGCPRHWGCRSTIVPITLTYRELGIDIDETKGTRASDMGQIESDTTFSEFLKRHDDNYADDLLGPGRAKLWREGKITLTDLMGQHGRPLTLSQLKAK